MIYYLLCSILCYYHLQIDHEFSLMFPGSEDKFIEKFPTHFMPRIIKYAEFCKSDATEKNNDIDDGKLK